MLLKLKKKNIKVISYDKANVPAEMTPQVAGGLFKTWECTGTRTCPGTYTTTAC
ncbi:MULTISPECIES: hypothetical protein [Pseudoalteromonas]|uniref:Uncharacterized protein n=1 Tax=Pseudoalteromonas obscura TaxID=3048491 RepID=A0ABT7EUP2_9GAMM|nr:MULTISPECIES: hypothetical protein [Pseudoalteromonas]MBQ4840091.1 hypothetical protein [Pseudoalteromonas luteoviolacea]MDK2598724.1 hypothetical protein [Pseudoalteromonas sp. P94(2023)]